MMGPSKGQAKHACNNNTAAIPCAGAAPLALLQTLLSAQSSLKCTQKSRFQHFSSFPICASAQPSARAPGEKQQQRTRAQEWMQHGNRAALHALPSPRAGKWYVKRVGAQERMPPTSMARMRKNPARPANTLVCP